MSVIMRGAIRGGLLVCAALAASGGAFASSAPSSASRVPTNTPAKTEASKPEITKTEGSKPEISKKDTAAGAAKAPVTLKDRLASAERALAAAPDDKASQQAWSHAEALRKRSLTGGTRLLLDESQEKAAALETRQALEDLSAALTLQPDSAFLRRTRAEMRLLANDPTGAVEDLGVALDRDPGDPAAWFLLARTQETLRNGPAALSAFQKALKLAPRFPERATLERHFTNAATGQPD